MDIVILANNPLFIEKNRSLIREYATSAGLFVSIKFKFLDAVIDLGLKRHDIYFRSNPSNFVFGLDDYRALADRLGIGTRIFLINDSELPDHELKNDPIGIEFLSFDTGPVLRYLTGFRNEPVYEELRRFMSLGECLDVTLLSTGFIVILHHLLQYPDSRIVLLGFYEQGNQRVMKEGRFIRDTIHHDFGCEKRVLQKIAGGLTYVN
jgi:hypothetical protein